MIMPGARFQVAFEGHGSVFVLEVDEKIHLLPRSAVGGVRAPTSIVRFEPRTPVARDTGAIAR